jgi:transposase
MARTRNTYTADFKLQAVKMLTDQHLSVAEVARRLGVSENCLRQWRKAVQAVQAAGTAAFPGPGQTSPADDEFRRLRAENVRLRAERDLLKKAAAYFASPPS